MADALVDAEVFRLDPVMPSRLSMSFVRAAGLCLRRAHYERISDSTGEDAVIGRVFHEIRAAVGWATVMRGETAPDYAEVERITTRVLREPDEHDPMSRHVWTEVRELVGRWMLTAEFHPDSEFEISARRELHGQIVSARIDERYIDKAENVAHVKDAKTGRADPPQRPEPTPQGDIYALLTLYEHPYLDGVWFQEEHVRFGYPPQPYFYDLDEIAEVDAWLGDQIARIESAYRAGGELPANPGDACSKFSVCPVADTCPAKKWAREATAVRTSDDAMSEFAELLTEETTVKALRDRLKAWAERETLRALIDTEADALLELAALIASETSVAKRKAKLRGYVQRAGVRAIALNGQELGYGDPGRSTDWETIALTAGADPSVIEANTKAKAPSFARRKAK